MRKIVALFLLALCAASGIAFPSPSVSYACDCAEPNPAEALANAKLVFTGEVLRVKKQERQARVLGPIEHREANHFKVTESWKGAEQTELIVFDRGSEASCGIDFQVGARYLVYAYQERNGDAYTGQCSVKELTAAASDLRVLGPGVEPQTIFIKDHRPRRLSFRDYRGELVLLGVGLVVLSTAALLVRRRRRRKNG
ncbi:hypothetical protein [Paenibacillus methanolicus]|uniref:Tissue inhibitor of metalloproteinase n=1 Tax=Paenibacillus methanolicus TaxID=582686 RepID=A0A5S5BTU9_9BACL|nr:hypothetical protein [Paenibacillus methanolicus]TYP69726.1 tissue inhibitor of metalloproteinase [Paenibacillus methanolicus]